MKINPKKINDKAVSAVIGVIIMVAITVAMAAVAYAYFTGMIGEQNKEAPVIDFVKSDSDKIITVATADIDSNWNDINISFINATGYTYLTKTGPVQAGDKIDLRNDQILRGTVTITLTHVPSNSLLATYIIENV
jgi:flagellin-like protein